VLLLTVCAGISFHLIINYFDLHLLAMDWGGGGRFSVGEKLPLWPTVDETLASTIVYAILATCDTTNDSSLADQSTPHAEVSWHTRLK